MNQKEQSDVDGTQNRPCGGALPNRTAFQDRAGSGSPFGQTESGRLPNDVDYVQSGYRFGEDTSKSTSTDVATGALSLPTFKGFDWDNLRESAKEALPVVEWVLLWTVTAAFIMLVGFPVIIDLTNNVQAYFYEVPFLMIGLTLIGGMWLCYGMGSRGRVAWFAGVSLLLIGWI